MKVLVCEKPGLLEYVQREEPIAQTGQTIVKIKRIGICGTDLHSFEGTQPYFQYPRVLGHELAVEIIEPERGSRFSIGEQVSFIPYLHCGECIACKNGKTNCCISMKVFGVHMDGGMAEFLSVPTHLLGSVEGLNLDEIALMEPLAIGAHGARRADIKPNESVLIIGAGPIGLCTVEFAKLAGAHVIVMDINAQRLAYCKEKFSIQHTILASSENILEQLKDITDGEMPTVVMDATGNLQAINQAFQFVAHGGRYILIGLQKGDIIFSHPEFHKRETTLMSSRNATKTDFEYVLKSIQDKKIIPLDFITHRVAFDQVKDHFANWLNPATGVIKAMVAM